MAFRECALVGIALYVNICYRGRARRSKREEASEKDEGKRTDEQRRSDNQSGITWTRSTRLLPRLEGLGRGGRMCVSPYEYRCNVRIVVARLPVEQRVAIMRSYNIAIPRNDIKLCHKGCVTCRTQSREKRSTQNPLVRNENPFKRANPHRLRPPYKRMFFAAPKLHRNQCHFCIITVTFI